MKRKILMLTMAIFIASYGANAQDINLTYAKYDSITNITTNSAKVWSHFNGETGTGFSEVCFGPGGNFNTNCTVPSLLGPVADTSFAVMLTGLTSFTTYSFKVKLLPGTSSGSSTVGTFTTLNCFPTPSVSASAGDSICSGVLDTLTVSPLGDSRQWKKNSVIIPGATSATYVANASGNYSCDITIAGCTEPSSPFVLIVNPLPTVTAGASVNAICVGASTTLTAGGASTYLWSSGQTAISFSASPLVTTTYTVTGTDVNACFKSTSVVITVNAPPTATITPNDSICLGSSKVLTATGGNSYLWSPSTGLSSTTSASPTANPTSTKTYTVIVTSVNGCKDTVSINLKILTLPIATITPNDSICLGLSKVLTATGGNSYLWSPSTGLSSTTSASPTANPTSTTTYTAIVTDPYGCKDTAFTKLKINPLPVVTGVVSATTLCIGGTITATASGASSYVWSNGSTGSPVSMSLTSNTNLRATGTSVDGCVDSSGVVAVTVYSQPVVNVTSSVPAICIGSPVTFTATGASTYVWSNGSTTNPLTLSPGSNLNLSAVGNDTHTCKDTSVVVGVTVNAQPIVTEVVSASTLCIGGTITATASGASSYVWSNGSFGSTNTFSPIVNTNIRVFGTDGNGCKDTSSFFTITVKPLPIVIAYTSSSSVCVGSLVTLSGSGANTYQWNTGQTDASFNFAPTNTFTYNLQGTDTYGCINTSNVTVTVNPLPTVSISGNSSYCMGGSTVLTGVGAVSYTWGPFVGLSSTVGTSVTASPNNTTSYTVTGTDANSCKNTFSIPITVYTPPVVIANGTGTLCSGLSANLSAFSGAGNTFTWSNGFTGTPIVVSPTVNTPYTVTVTDANSCTNSASVQVTVVANTSNVSFNTSKDTVCKDGVNSVINLLNASPSGGTWSSNVTGNSFNSVNALDGPNTLTYTVTDANGCPKSLSKDVIVNSAPGITGYPTIIGIGSVKTVIVQLVSALNSSLKIKITTTSDVVYIHTASPQNSSSAVFSNILLNDGDMIFFFLGDPNDGCSTPVVSVGVGELSIEEMKIYPNPVLDILNIELPYDKYDFHIINKLGQTVYSKTEEGNSFKFSKNNLSPGLYLVNIISAKGRTATKKILVE